ncbi:MAG: zinc-ribbon domain-containing protein [Oscillospiraceae bacterium]|nr:zinc-ribbon domain-containing protein [Oscillospiraceae bacterium]MDD3832836.1 zinc-ribbon domain-containing protein [Oscillospiraceae bacterium]MDD4546506.1 zinc-ribbon domain-containing protein [Oscillospiraceae bacterium]
MNCTNCGKEIANYAKFCDGCGTPIVTQQVNPQAAPVQAPVTNDDQENKVIFILSYLLFFLPLVSCPNSKTGRFHANQGLLLLITAVAGSIAVAILSTILFSISWRLWTIIPLFSWAWGIAVIVLVVMGMINANKGEQKPLPIIGKFTLIK